MVHTKHVPISVSICKILGKLETAVHFTPTAVPIEYIDKIIVSGPNSSLELFIGNGTYETMVILDKVFHCKEFAIPDSNVNNIRIIHRIAINKYGKYDKENGKGMKIFVHMQGALLLNQFVEEIDQNLIDDEEIPFSTIYLKLENYGLSQGVKCMEKGKSYDKCIFEDTLMFLNQSLGCALPLKRFLQYYIIRINMHVQPHHYLNF